MLDSRNEMEISKMPTYKQTLIPTLTVNNADAAIAFYQKAFEARSEGHVMRGPDGKSVMHAELFFGEMKIFLNDEMPNMGAYGPTHFGGSSTSLYLYVPDVDQVYGDAIANGAKSGMPPADQFWGDRFAMVIDPFGHRWGIATTKENLTQDQVKERSEEHWKPQTTK